MKKSIGLICLASLLVLSGCSNAMKKRQEQREKVAATSGLFCEFVSGDDHKDVDVELNFSMARRCDPAKNFTVTSYKSSAEVNGLVYCCSIKRNERAAPVVKAKAETKVVPESKAPEKVPVPAASSNDVAP
ncbi:MAG TPA: hypothetical protein PL182_03740 [Pseudobdellovibrionaceae bacterium]|nr:hypothetical protein [Pseudobdellovibrionaceae bacterium]